MGFKMLLPIFASALLGGIGRPYGAMAGGLVIGVIEELSTYPWIGTELAAPARLQGGGGVRDHGRDPHLAAERAVPRPGVLRAAPKRREPERRRNPDMEQLYGIFLYAVFLLTMGGIYAVLALGLNIQWGFTGLFNAGVAGFFAIGAYTSAILTSAASTRHLGGFGLPVGSRHLRRDGCERAHRVGGRPGSASGSAATTSRSPPSESPRSSGSCSRTRCGRPTGRAGSPSSRSRSSTSRSRGTRSGCCCSCSRSCSCSTCLLERARRSPWGRVMAAIRENEDAARAAGKDVERLRIEAFILGGRPHGARGRADGPPHQVHRAQCGGAGLGNLPGLGYARHRREREQPGRDPGRDPGLGGLVGHRDTDDATDLPSGRPSRHTCGSSSSGLARFSSSCRNIPEASSANAAFSDLLVHLPHREQPP